MSERFLTARLKAIRFLVSQQREDSSWGPSGSIGYRITATSLALSCLTERDGADLPGARKFLVRALEKMESKPMTRLLAWPLLADLEPEFRRWLMERLMALQTETGGWGHASRHYASSRGVEQLAQPSLFPTFLVIFGLRKELGEGCEPVVHAIERAVRWMVSLPLFSNGTPTTYDSEHAKISHCAFALSILELTDTHLVSDDQKTRLSQFLAENIRNQEAFRSESIQDVGRELDTPYQLFTPAWTLLALSLYGGYGHVPEVLKVAAHLLSLQSPTGGVAQEEGGSHKDIYVTSQFILAIDKANHYLSSGVVVDNALEQAALDARYATRRPGKVCGERHGRVTEQREPIDVAIVCALQSPEFEKLKGVHPSVVWKPLSLRDSHRYWKCQITSKTGRIFNLVAGVPSLVGLTASAILTTKLVHLFSPKIVIMVGIAAGTKGDDRNYGDILVVQQAVDYSAGKLQTGQDNELIFAADPHPVPIPQILLAALQSKGRDYLDEIRNQWPGTRPRSALDIHIGTVGSGDLVIANTSPMRDIKQHWRKLMGVEMETYAVYRAALEAVPTPPLYVSFKAICDFASSAKADDWQDYAAYTAAQYCYRFIRNDLEEILESMHKVE